MNNRVRESGGRSPARESRDSAEPINPILPPLPRRATAGLKPALPAYSNDHLRRWMHEGLAGMPPSSAVLAIGCEEAFLAPHLAEYSADVTVLDTSGGQIAQLARRFPEIAFLPHNPSNPLPFPHDTFDAIWCCEFLDRIFDPASALREMHRVLAPGGRLLATVPDHGHMRNVLIALFKWEEHFAPSNPRIRHFTRGTLSKLAREAGFAEVQTETGGSVRRLAGELVPRSLLLKAKKAPGAQLVCAATRGNSENLESVFAQDLAFAGRSHVA